MKRGPRAHTHRSVSSVSLESRGEDAMRRCAEQIAWYERFSSPGAAIFVAFQRGAILLGAATPVLISLAVAPEGLPGPAGSVSVRRGRSCRDIGLAAEQARYAYTTEALKTREGALYDPHIAIRCRQG